MTLEEKRLFLAFKKELKEIKDIIDFKSRKTKEIRGNIFVRFVEKNLKVEDNWEDTCQKNTLESHPASVQQKKI